MAEVEVVEKVILKLEVDDLDKLSLGQIRDMLDEIRHSFQHLTRSQEDLLDALQEEADEDLAQAYWENIEVLESKKVQMEKITKYLEENDFAYMQHQKSLPDSLPQAVPGEEEELDDEDGSIASMIASRATNTVQLAQETTAPSAADSIAENNHGSGNVEEGLYL